MHCSPQFTLASVSLTVWHACVCTTSGWVSALPPASPRFPRALTGKKGTRAKAYAKQRQKKSERQEKRASERRKNNFEVKEKEERGEWGHSCSLLREFHIKVSLQLFTCSGDAAANRGNSWTNFKMAKKEKKTSLCLSAYNSRFCYFYWSQLMFFTR